MGKTQLAEHIEYPEVNGDACHNLLSVLRETSNASRPILTTDFTLLNSTDN